MILKSFIPGVAVVAIGAAAVGASSMTPAVPQIQPMVFAAPYPQAPAADVPTADQLAGVLNGLADPGVPFADKGGLVEGGIAPNEASMADHKLNKAARKGELPLSFGVANIQPAGAGAATADVTVSGPKLAPVTTNITFVDQGGWKVSRGSVASLLRAA